LEEGLAQQGWPFFLEIEVEKPVFREVNAFTKPLTPLAAVCILNPAIFPVGPAGGKLSNNEIGKTIKIPLEREMKRIDAPFNNCRLTRFDIVMHTLLRPPRLWIAFNSLAPAYDQPAHPGWGAGCYKPAASGGACASVR
jgi:hypothetical protein